MTRARVPTQRALLHASGLSRSYADVKAVAQVDLDVAPGEIHALVGLNGAGKTTLLRLLLGMVHPDEGQLTLFGRRLVDMVAADWARVGHLIETPFGYPELTVAENLIASARLYGLSRSAATEAATSTVATLALAQWAHRRASTLSLGNRQRLGLACALAHRPDVLVLDEPTNALDPRGVLVVRAALRNAAERGAAVLVSSHHLDEVARIADRISVLHAGVLIGSLDPGSVDIERQFFAMVLAAEPELTDQPTAGS
jgi:ABC-2 type transport system ATP-binding protein